ncbi:uncharacterized protein LOC144163240 isoform X4 [Haemaphysalis longicornis]
MRSRTGSSIFPDVLPSYTEEPPTENRVGRSPSIVFESIFNIAMFVSVFSGISIGFMVRYLSNKPWTARQSRFPSRLPLAGHVPGFPGRASEANAPRDGTTARRVQRGRRHGLDGALAVASSAAPGAGVRAAREALGAGERPVGRAYGAARPHHRTRAHPAEGAALRATEQRHGRHDLRRHQGHISGKHRGGFYAHDTTGVHGEGPSRIVNDSAGILLFCALLGAVLSGNEGGVLLGFFIGLSNAMMLIAHLVLIYSPFGVFFLTVAYIVDIEDLSRLLSHMGRYLFTVMAGLALHAVIILPLLFVAATRRSYRALLSNVALPLVVAFSTTSGMATVPATIAVLEERLRLEPRIASFRCCVAWRRHPSGALDIYDSTSSARLWACRPTTSDCCSSLTGLWIASPRR